MLMGFVQLILWLGCVMFELHLNFLELHFKLFSIYFSIFITLDLTFLLLFCIIPKVDYFKLNEIEEMGLFFFYKHICTYSFIFPY